MGLKRFITIDYLIFCANQRTLSLYQICIRIHTHAHILPSHLIDGKHFPFAYLINSYFSHNFYWIFLFHLFIRVFSLFDTTLFEHEFLFPHRNIFKKNHKEKPSWMEFEIIKIKRNINDDAIQNKWWNAHNSNKASNEKKSERLSVRLNFF